MGELKIEVPEKLDIWASFDANTREKIALFAYMEGQSIEEYLKGGVESIVDSDSQIHAYNRAEPENEE